MCLSVDISQLKKACAPLQFSLRNTGTVGVARPGHMTWGTGHWCVAVVYETLSPQINVRWGKEEEEEEERMAGSHHCRPSRSPCRTERGGAADSAVKRMNIHTSRSHRLLSSVWERILFSSLPALIFPTQILPSGPASEEVDNQPPSLGISTRLKTALPSF